MRGVFFSGCIEELATKRDENAAEENLDLHCYTEKGVS